MDLLAKIEVVNFALGKANHGGHNGRIKCLQLIANLTIFAASWQKLLAILEGPQLEVRKELRGNLDRLQQDIRAILRNLRSHLKRSECDQEHPLAKFFEEHLSVLRIAQLTHATKVMDLYCSAALCFLSRRYEEFHWKRYSDILKHQLKIIFQEEESRRQLQEAQDTVGDDLKLQGYWAQGWQHSTQGLRWLDTDSLPLQVVSAAWYKAPRINETMLQGQDQGLLSSERGTAPALSVTSLSNQSNSGFSAIRQPQEPVEPWTVIPLRFPLPSSLTTTTQDGLEAQHNGIIIGLQASLQAANRRYEDLESKYLELRSTM